MVKVTLTKAYQEIPFEFEHPGQAMQLIQSLVCGSKGKVELEIENIEEEVDHE